MAVLSILVSTSLVIGISGSFFPWVSMCFESVPAVIVTVADVVSMLGTIMGYLEPFLSLGIALHNPFIGSRYNRVCTIRAG